MLLEGEELVKWTTINGKNTELINLFHNAKKDKLQDAKEEKLQDAEKDKLKILSRPTRLSSWGLPLKRIVGSWRKAQNAYRDIGLMVIVLFFVELCFAALSIMGVGLMIGRKIAGLFI